MKKYLVLSALLISSSLSLAQADNCACCSEVHKAFDFWLGTWEVTNTDGSAAGKNTIVKEQDGCILKENWTSATAGYTGASTNYYNGSSQQWEQLWIDNSGNHLKLKGNRVGNQMILASEEFERPDGKSYINRISWTANEDGTVRQLWEVLQGDKVVSISFDGLYTRVNN